MTRSGRVRSDGTVTRRSRRRPATRWPVAAVAASAALAAVAVVGACAGDGEAIPDPSLTPVTSAATAESIVPGSASTSSDEPGATVASPASTTPTSAAGSSVSSTLDGAAITGPMFSDALGVKVDSAPGVNTRGDTRQLLPEGLFVHIAWESDPNDLSVFTAQPEDIEILEAYANAMLTFYRESMSTVTTESPDFATYFVDAGATYADNFAEARAGGYVGSLGSGVVLRPYMLGDRRTATSAVLLDCYLENEGYILRQGGSPDLGPLEPSGTIATMTKQSGHWQVSAIGTEPKACL
ncbi:MAG: hypothetical protein AAB131_15260 [Actinomycetota bacterium]